MIGRRALLRSIFLGAADRPALVAIFLRGGADGLNMVAPRAEREYYELRPTLALRQTLPLDDRFGFHPAFEPLVPLFREGRLAIVHAVGSDDETRSHFEAQDLMEHAGRPQEGVSGGWLGRHLRTRPGSGGAIACVSIGPTIPESLRAAPSACALESIEQVSLPEATPRFTEAMRVLYESEASKVGKAGLATFRLLERVGRAREAPVPQGYSEGTFSRRLREVARLLKAEVGLEAACLDLDGWDSHYVQAPLLNGRIGELATGLAAFVQDLGPRIERTYVVVMTEFGRRSYENATLGTDHGRASVFFALGGRVRGGRVTADWPGLGQEAMDGPGDLKVTIDYRDLLAEIISHGLGNPRLEEVFPGHRPNFRGLISR